MAVTTNAWVEADTASQQICDVASALPGADRAEVYWEWVRSITVASDAKGLSVGVHRWSGHALTLTAGGRSGVTSAVLGTSPLETARAAARDGIRSARQVLPALPIVNYPVVDAERDHVADGPSEELVGGPEAMAGRVREAASRANASCLLARAFRKTKVAGYRATYGISGSYAADWFGLVVTLRLPSTDHGIGSASYWGTTWPDPDEVVSDALAQAKIMAGPEWSDGITRLPMVLSGRALGMLLSGTWTVFTDKAAWIRFGERMTRGRLSVADDPLLPGTLGTAPFDGDGVRSRLTPLISNGNVVERLIHRCTGEPSPTANGVRENYWTPSVCMPSTMVVEPGQADETDLNKDGRTLMVQRIYLDGPMALQHQTGRLRATVDGAVMDRGSVIGVVRRKPFTCAFADLLNGVVAVGRRQHTHSHRGVYITPSVRMEPPVGEWL